MNEEIKKVDSDFRTAFREYLEGNREKILAMLASPNVRYCAQWGAGWKGNDPEWTITPTKGEPFDVWCGECCECCDICKEIIPGECLEDMAWTIAEPVIVSRYGDLECFVSDLLKHTAFRKILESVGTTGDENVWCGVVLALKCTFEDIAIELLNKFAGLIHGGDGDLLV